MDDRIHPQIHTVSIFWEQIQSTIEAYLVKGKMNALIDSGPPQTSPDVISQALAEFGVTPAEIDLVLHTHGHVDHVGGDEPLKAAGRAKLLIHREDALFLEDHSRCFDLFYAAGRDKKTLEQEKTMFLKQVEPELPVDKYLEDGEIVDLGAGVELRILHLPGHTPGSVGFYWEKEGILLAGDSIPGLNNQGGSLPIIHDFVAYQKSIERLQGIDLRTLVFCHPYRGINLPPSRVRRDKEIDEYLADSMDLARRLGEAFRQAGDQTGKSPAEIADGVITRLPAEMGFKRIAEIPTPHFSLGTVFWGLARVKRQS
jgi:glyoxylase-like metal-dependent hydrolase (beta-lactamase superfamily II)